MSGTNTSPASKNLRSHSAQSADPACGSLKVNYFHKDTIKESAGKVIGLSNDKFREELLPLSSTTTSFQHPDNPFASLQGARRLNENQIAERWVEIVNFHSLSPGFRCALSRHKADKGDPMKERVDAAFFEQSMVPTNHAPNWGDQIVSVEFKKESMIYDPFDDLKDGSIVDSDSLSRVRVRGQIISYAEHIFSIQQRTAHFSLIVMGRFFRAIRWDRSGAFVTPRTNYVDNPHELCEFLRRFGLASSDILGFDPSAQRLRPEEDEYKRMDEAADLEKHEGDIMLPSKPIPVPVAEEGLDEGPTFRYVREAFKESLKDPLWPRFKLTVPTKIGQRYFLVGKPTFGARDLLGRGTRGYVALDCSSGRFVFLKDAWRANYELLECEGAVLEQLNDTSNGQRHVSFVPTLVCHGDIGDQITRTPEVWRALRQVDDALLPSDTQATPDASALRPSTSNGKVDSQPQAHVGGDNPSEGTAPNGDKSSSKNPFRLHKHYRIVVEEVSMPLSKFRKGKELVVAIYDCVTAHFMASDKAKILHRDISSGNILLYPNIESTRCERDGEAIETKNWVLGGLLIDWELAKPTSVQMSRQPQRMATWQFMSVESQRHPSSALCTADELESFYHVTLYHGVRYMYHNIADVYLFLKDFFDACDYNGDVPVCAPRKKAAMAIGDVEYPAESQVFLNFHSPSNPNTHPLTALLKEMLLSFQARYLVLDSELSIVDPSTLSLVPSTPADIRAKELPPGVKVVDRSRKMARARPKVTRADRELAEALNTHDDFLNMLYDAIHTYKWPEDDKLGDHLASIAKAKSKGKKRAHEDFTNVSGAQTGSDKRHRVSTTSYVSGSQILASNSTSPEEDWMTTHSVESSGVDFD